MGPARSSSSPVWSPRPPPPAEPETPLSDDGPPPAAARQGPSRPDRRVPAADLDPRDSPAAAHANHANLDGADAAPGTSLSQRARRPRCALRRSRQRVPRHAQRDRSGRGDAGRPDASPGAPPRTPSRGSPAPTRALGPRHLAAGGVDQLDAVAREVDEHLLARGDPIADPGPKCPSGRVVSL